MSKILVTGATGFVGRSLVPALILAGHEVRCAVTQKRDWLQAEQVLINKLELQTDWSEVLQGIDTVIHLAARVHVMQKTDASSLGAYCEINSKATKIIAEQAVKHHVKQFIYLSSIKVNGEFTLSGSPFTEENDAQPEDPYGQSKLYAEQYLQSICHNTGMQFVIIRPPLVYGPGVKANFLKTLQLVSKGWPLPFARVYNQRHFIYIENLVSALCVVIDNPRAANQVYLVADDESLSLTHLLRLLAQAMNVKSRLIPVPVTVLTRVFKVAGMSTLNSRLFSSLEVNTDKIKFQLGWTPPFTCAEGLGKTATWYQCDSNS
ncbi:MAG: NAD-dependent epimerase/dehydratase family protein [Legionellales bacterium]